MALKRTFSILGAAAVAFALANGCSSSNPTDPGDGGTADDASTDRGRRDVEQGDAQSGCAPGDLTGFTLPAYKPAKPRDPKCTTQALTELKPACFADSATRATCEAWEKAYPDCDRCAFSSAEANPTWGPIVFLPNNLISLNLAGCVELLDPAQLQCAKDYQASDACEKYACRPNCPIVDSTTDNGKSVEDYNKCSNDAAAGVCKEHGDKAKCMDTISANDAGASAKCFQGESFEDAAVNIIDVFCGGAVPSDAGTDAPADAPAEGG